MWSMWDANQWFNVIEFHHQLQNMFFFFETCSLQNLGEWLKHVQTPAIKMVPWLGLSTWEAEWMVVSNRWEQWYNDQDQREVTLGPLSLVSINYTGSNQKGPQEEAYLTNSSKGKYQKGMQTGHVGLLGEQRFCPFSHNSKKVRFLANVRLPSQLSLKSWIPAIPAVTQLWSRGFPGLIFRAHIAFWRRRKQGHGSRCRMPHALSGRLGIGRCDGCDKSARAQSRVSPTNVGPLTKKRSSKILSGRVKGWNALSETFKRPRAGTAGGTLCPPRLAKPSSSMMQSEWFRRPAQEFHNAF